MPELDPPPTPSPAPPPAAFISYCRADSDFALRLAQDLKAAGAQVWIDQLDIAAGELWDNAIENALIASPRMLLVLSPASARSDNVRNEISFALEQGKTIVPVLYRDCTVPLQLQRANRIDFRADYTHGLRTLLAGLHVTHPDAEALREAEEAETRRRTAWDAREAEALRLQEFAGRKPPSPDPPPTVPAPVPISIRRPWFQLTIGRFAIAGGLAAALIVGIVLRQTPSASSGAAAPAPIVEAPSTAPQPEPENGPQNGRQNEGQPKPAPNPQDADIYGVVPACVFDPVSNVRVEPKAASPIACSIDTVRDIQVHSVPVEAAGALWWQTDVCGKKGYIADNQVHVNQQCTPAAAARVAVAAAAPSARPPSPATAALARNADDLYGRKQYDQALPALTQACNAGVAAACAHLGHMYEAKLGVVQDYASARDLFTRACNAGDAEGCGRLGFLYSQGNGVAEDDKKAQQLLTKGCNGSYLHACFNLGKLYDNGSGVPVDYGHAAQLYKKACDGNDGNACGELGYLYITGLGVPQDWDRAKPLLQKGCSMGSQVGCVQLDNVNRAAASKAANP